MTDWKAPDWMIESLQSFEYEENEEDIEIIDKPLSGPAHFRYGTTWTAEEREAHRDNPFFDKEHQSRAGAKGGRTTKDNGLGIFNPEYDRTPDVIKGGQTGAGGRGTRDKGVGIFDPKNKAVCDVGRAKVHKQLYKCVVTGYTSNACGLSNYQKGKGINYKDKSLRVKVTHP